MPEATAFKVIIDTLHFPSAPLGVPSYPFNGTVTGCLLTVGDTCRVRCHSPPVSNKAAGGRRYLCTCSLYIIPVYQVYIALVSRGHAAFVGV